MTQGVATRPPHANKTMPTADAEYRLRRMVLRVVIALACRAKNSPMLQNWGHHGRLETALHVGLSSSHTPIRCEISAQGTSAPLRP